ncbi:MAG TPA: NTP transferase domain-containing protein [Dongiaceae bacterium]|nr:NTP transferase domain-containing protein [Dongiaceae bacterium]
MNAALHPKQSPSLLILAAGLGSRYGGLKQMDPVGPGGETIMDYSIYDAVRAGFGRVVFVIRHDFAAAFKEMADARFARHVAVEYVFQELENLPPGFSVPAGRTKPWGTGHAILSAAPALSGPFATINADDFYGAESFRLLAHHLNSGSPDYAMVGFALKQTLTEFGSVARGICQVDRSGWLESVTEVTGIQPRVGGGAQSPRPDGTMDVWTGTEPVSMNLWGFPPSIFESLRQLFGEFLKQRGHEEKSEFYIPAVVNALVAAGRVRCRVWPTTASWFGVTYREDRPQVAARIRQLVAAGAYPEKLWT